MLRRFLSLIGAIVLWQGMAWGLNSVVFPDPVTCFSAAILAIEDGSLWSNSIASLTRVAIGYSIAALLGVTLGALSGITSSIGLMFRDILEFLRPIPPIAWVPLAIVWFGIGDSSAWFIVFMGAFFPIFIQVSHAFSTCSDEYLEVAKAYEASPWITFWWVRCPAAAPQIAQGLRVGLGLAWTSVIAAELVGVKHGLGDRIQQLRYVSDYEGMIVCMITIGLLGWAMIFGTNILQRWWIPWHKSSM